MHDPKAGVTRHLPRVRPGWGDNCGLHSPPWSATGGQWFDMGWKPQLESKLLAGTLITFYVDLLKVQPARLEREQLQRDPGALQRGQVRDVDRRDHRRLPSSPTRKQTRWRTRWPSRRAPTAPRRRRQLAVGLGAGVPAGTRERRRRLPEVHHWATSKEYIPAGSRPAAENSAADQRAQVDPRTQFPQGWQRYSPRPRRRPQPAPARTALAQISHWRAILKPGGRAIGICRWVAIGAALSGKTSWRRRSGTSQQMQTREMLRAGDTGGSPRTSDWVPSRRAGTRRASSDLAMNQSIKQHTIVVALSSGNFKPSWHGSRRADATTNLRL